MEGNMIYPMSLSGGWNILNTINQLCGKDNECKMLWFSYFCVNIFFNCKAKAEKIFWHHKIYAESFNLTPTFLHVWIKDDFIIPT